MGGAPSCSGAPSTNFTSCDDGNAATFPDFCYGGECVSASDMLVGAPVEEDACTGRTNQWSGIDIDYFNNDFYVLVNGLRSHAITTGGGVICPDFNYTGVYRTTPDGLDFSDFTRSGIASPNATAPAIGRVLRAGYIAGSDQNGVNAFIGAVDGSGKFTQDGAAMQTLLQAVGAGAISTIGVLDDGVAFPAANVWFGGLTNAGTEAFVSHCSRSSCSANLVASANAAAVVGMAIASTSGVYDGAIAAAVGTTDSYVYEDRDADEAIESASTMAGAVATGLVAISAHQVLVYGRGGFFEICTRASAGSTWKCVPLTMNSIDGVAQSAFNFVDATPSPYGDILVISTAYVQGLSSADTGTYNYLSVLPAGSNALAAAAWKHFRLSGGKLLSRGLDQLVAGVAASAEEIKLVGTQAMANRVQLWSLSPH